MLDIEDTNSILEFLEHNKTLESLELSGLYLYGAHAIKIGEILKQNTTLTSLELCENKIFSKGIEAIAKALNQNTTLTSLKLSDASIEGLKAIAELLKQNTTLTSLELCGQPVNSEGIEAIAEALKQNSTLTSLNLIGLNLRSGGPGAIAEILKQNTTLTTLYLNPFMELAEVQLIAEALKQNRTLTKLDLPRNRLATSHNILSYWNLLGEIDKLLKGNKDLQTLLPQTKKDDAGQRFSLLEKTAKVVAKNADIDLSRLPAEIKEPLERYRNYLGIKQKKAAPIDEKLIELTNCIIKGNFNLFQQLISSNSNVNTNANTNSNANIIANSVNAKNEDGLTLLHILSFEQAAKPSDLNVKFLKALLQAGANPNIKVTVDPKKTHDWSPVHFAVYFGQLEFINVYKDFVDWKSVNDEHNLHAILEVGKNNYPNGKHDEIAKVVLAKLTESPKP